MLSSFTPSGNPESVALSRRGVAIGICDMLDGGVRRTELEVLVPGKALWISAEAISGMLERGGRSAQAIGALASRAIRASIRGGSDLYRGSVDQRLARLLARMAADGGLEDARGTLIPTRVSRVKVAGAIGCRLETLVRLLKSKEMAALISFEREGIILHDLHALRALAEGE